MPSRARFTEVFDSKHSISLEGDKKAVSVLGNDDFPFPVQLIRKRSAWDFDTAAGRLDISTGVSDGCDQHCVASQRCLRFGAAVASVIAGDQGEAINPMAVATIQ